MALDTAPGGERIAFIGVGAMGGAIARGLVRAGVSRPQDLWLSDARPEVATALAASLGAHVAPSNRAACEQAPVALLAVKPQVAAGVLADLRPAVTEGHLFISIMGGVTLASIEGALGPGARVVRVMPNILCEVGEAVSVYAEGTHVRSEDRDRVERILGSVGRVVPAAERLMDAVTGLSGSGPAFCFLMIQALADGGTRMGLPRDLAVMLAAQTMAGAGRMVLETGTHPEALKDRVTSPAGTTAEGLAEMEAGGVRSALIRAVAAATRRSQELSNLS